MELEDCKHKGHNLKVVRSTVGHECTREGCDYYISLGNESHNINIGKRFDCPRCRLSGRDKFTWEFWHGVDHVQFKCPNCGYEWVEG